MGEDNFYRKLIDRNIGFIDEGQQARLRDSCVAIFGLGGLGGVAAQLLCRCGIGCIKIIDDEKFEPTNLNRQVFCYNSTLGKSKVEVTEEFLKDINPGVTIERYSREDENNIEEILKGTDAAVLAVDKARACIVISRAAKRLGVPLVEGWALPCLNVRVFTKDTMGLEEVYGLPTINKKIEDISENEFKDMSIRMLETLFGIEGIKSFYHEEAKERVMRGINPSFAPAVWLTAALMGMETIKILLKLGNIALAPHFALYDPFLNRIPKQSV